MDFWCVLVMVLSSTENTLSVPSQLPTDSDCYGKYLRLSRLGFSISAKKAFGNPTKDVIECLRVLAFPLYFGTQLTPLAGGCP